MWTGTVPCWQWKGFCSSSSNLNILGHLELVSSNSKLYIIEIPFSSPLALMRNFWKGSGISGLLGHWIEFIMCLICKYWKKAELGMLCLWTANGLIVLFSKRESRLITPNLSQGASCDLLTSTGILKKQSLSAVGKSIFWRPHWIATHARGIQGKPQGVVNPYRWRPKYLYMLHWRVY